MYCEEHRQIPKKSRHWERRGVAIVCCTHHTCSGKNLIYAFAWRRRNKFQHFYLYRLDLVKPAQFFHRKFTSRNSECQRHVFKTILSQSIQSRSSRTLWQNSPFLSAVTMLLACLHPCDMCHMVHKSAFEINWYFSPHLIGPFISQSKKIQTMR